MSVWTAVGDSTFLRAILEDARVTILSGNGPDSRDLGPRAPCVLARGVEPGRGRGALQSTTSACSTGTIIHPACLGSVSASTREGQPRAADEQREPVEPRGRRAMLRVTKGAGATNVGAAAITHRSNAGGAVTDVLADAEYFDLCPGWFRPMSRVATAPATGTNSLHERIAADFSLRSLQAWRSLRRETRAPA